MKEFKVGDKVCMCGTIIIISGTTGYPIVVRWSDDTGKGSISTFTTDGCLYVNGSTILEHAKPDEVYTTLSSQEDCWRALLAGHKLQHCTSNNIYWMQEARLRSDKGDAYTVNFHNYKDWRLYSKPSWQDELATKDILCKVWDYSDDSTRYTRYITQYTSTKPIPYADIAGDLWQYAEPIPSEDLTKDKQ